MASSSSSSSSGSGFLARPRRGSRSHQQHKEQQHGQGQQPEPYTPVFQPAGYAYKIALPARPQPGQTPWPTHLPPVVHAPLSNATNRQRTSSSAVPSAQTQSQTQRGPMPQLTRSATLPPGSSYYPSSQSTSARSSFASSSARSSPPTSTSSSSSPSSWPHGLNPLLTSGALLWTLRLPPSYIKLRLSHLSTPGPLTYTHRAQPCASPSAHSLSILVALPGAVGPLRIACPPGTTLGALLDALYDLLHAPATRAEWAACNQPAAARAYRVRCGADGAQLAKGVRRVDLLGEGAAFAGLARGETSGEFVLRVVAL